MTPSQFKSKINSGDIDTVIVACPDLFGRLVGKRFTGKFFLDQVAKHGTHGCSYLLTVNIEMDPQDGFKLANWEKGFGDFAMRPDFSTLANAHEALIEQNRPLFQAAGDEWKKFFGAQFTCTINWDAAKEFYFAEAKKPFADPKRILAV